VGIAVAAGAAYIDDDDDDEVEEAPLRDIRGNDREGATPAIIYLTVVSRCSPAIKHCQPDAEETLVGLVAVGEQNSRRN